MKEGEKTAGAPYAAILLCVPVVIYLCVIGKVNAGTAIAFAVISSVFFAFFRKKAAGNAFLLVLLLAAAVVRGAAFNYSVNVKTEEFIKEYGNEKVLFCAEIRKDSASNGTEAEITGVAGGKAERIKVYIKHGADTSFFEGTKIEFYGTVRRIEEVGNPSFTKNLLKKGIKCVVSDAEIISTGFEKQNYVFDFQKTLYNYFSEKIDKSLNFISDKTEYNRARALAFALILGDKTKFSKEDYNKFGASGITHILCISGMHFSVIMALLLYAMNALGAFKKSPVKVRYAVFAAGAAFYLFTSAFALSAVRAAIMAVFMLYSAGRKARYGCTERLVEAFDFIILVSPRAVFDAGLHLSFLSCAGILLSLYFFEIFEKRYGKNVILCTVAGMFAISFSAFAFSSFYIAALYGGITPVGIAASFFSGLPAAIALCGAWIIAVFPWNYLGIFGKIAVYAYSFCAQILYKIADFFSKFSFTNIKIDMAELSLIVFFIGAFLCVAAAGKRTRGAKIYAAVCGFAVFLGAGAFIRP